MGYLYAVVIVDGERAEDISVLKDVRLDGSFNWDGHTYIDAWDVFEDKEQARRFAAKVRKWFHRQRALYPVPGVPLPSVRIQRVRVIEKEAADE